MNICQNSNIISVVQSHLRCIKGTVKSSLKISWKSPVCESITLNFSVYLKQAYTFIYHLYFRQISWVGIFCSEPYFRPREINGKKEVYREKYIFVHDSLPVWCICESYWKYVPWNQRKQYVYTKNVPQNSPIKKNV